jgi:hypothetical protein
MVKTGKHIHLHPFVKKFLFVPLSPLLYDDDGRCQVQELTSSLGLTGVISALKR